MTKRKPPELHKRKGPAPFAPSDIERGKVLALKACGAQHELIAKEIGIDRKTLEKHFRKELDDAAARQLINVENNLYQLTKTNTGAAVFFLINRAPDRWKDRKYLEGNLNIRDAPPPDFTNLSADERATLREATEILRKAQARKLIDVTPGKDQTNEHEAED